MSTCTKWIDQAVITCKNWAEQIDYKCTTLADQGSNQCSNWADEGSNQCSKWADEGSNQCSSWGECHWYTPWNCIAGWFCEAYYWIANWVCQAWYWVANLVCQAWYWVAKWVCKAFAWVVKAVCTVWSWVVKLVCVAWDNIRCLFVNLFSRKKNTPHNIEHVFVLMLENRAFDHMLGFSKITGTDAITGLPRTIEGVNPVVNKNNNPVTGTDVFVSTPADFKLKEIDIDPGHEFKNTLAQICGDGAVYPDPVTGGYPSTINNSGFVSNYHSEGSTTPERIMKCFDPSQLPIMNTLAKEFAICDNWFSSLPGPTWPNRFFLLAGTSGGLDDSPSNADLIEAVSLEGYRFENGNVFDLLDQYCLEWRIFEGDEFPISFAMSGMNLNALQGRFKDFEDFNSVVNQTDFSTKFVFIEPKYGSHNFDISGPGDFTCGNSMHPLDDVTRGEQLVKDVYETIRNSPHWEKSLIVVTFDEHGGFYDHVNPPAAIPPGDLPSPANIHNNFKFDQLGVRVPAIVISPFIKKGVIDHTVFDHTSVLATTEKIFGMANLTNRDKNANDFVHLLSLESPRKDALTVLPGVADSGFTCEDDIKTQERLIGMRSELVSAQQNGYYRDRDIRESKASNMQTGFAYVALLKLLQQSAYPERVKWEEEFKSMKTKIDAAKFLVEAKLKIKYQIDIKKVLREGEVEKLKQERKNRRKR